MRRPGDVPRGYRIAGSAPNAVAESATRVFQRTEEGQHFCRPFPVGAARR